VFYIVAWIPLPGMPHQSPSLWPYLDSLAAQVPLFGIVTLFATRPRHEGAYIAGGIVLLALFGAPELNESGFPLLLPVALFVLGICLITWSYRRLLNWDLG